MAARRSQLSHGVLDRAIGTARSQALRVAKLYGMHLLDDLQSALVIRAWKAWETFRAEEEATWPTWLSGHLRRGVQDVLRDHKATRKKALAQFREEFEVVSLQGTARRTAHPGMEDIHFGDVESDRDADVVRDVLRAEWIREVMRLLLPREREIVRRHYYGGELKQDIAADLGISPTRLRQIERHAMARIAENVDPMDVGEFLRDQTCRPVGKHGRNHEG